MPCGFNHGVDLQWLSSKFPGVSIRLQADAGNWTLGAKFPVLLKSAEELGLHQLVRNHLKLSISFPVSDPLPRHPMAFLVHLRWKHGELHLYLPASAETFEQAHHVRQVWRQSLLEKWRLGPRHEAQQWQWRSRPMQMRGELAQIDLEAARKAMELHQLMAELLCSVQFPFQRCCTRWNLRSHNLSQPPRGAGGLLHLCPVRQHWCVIRNWETEKKLKKRWRSDNWRRQEPNKNEQKSERCVSRCSYPWAPRRAVFRRLHLSRLR